LALEWLEASAETVGVKTAYLLAREQVDETLLAYAAAAATEAARRQTLRGVRRDRFEFAVPLDDDTAEVDVGDYVEVEHPRFGLSAGKTFVVMTVEPDAANRSMTIGVWG
jgi:ribosomal protein S17